ncbi:helix-turn-helix domain-containing protein [Compostimonas suwonensis]|uniref:helix-turn-helix domain-containing protein n=1 Tax=Compostimonas suwonensis TaxID=1048394 RepID=UPI000C2311A6|nr:helix-turn-helix transcriptional regulator [Compostimonas suwonensis]
MAPTVDGRSDQDQADSVDDEHLTRTITALEPRLREFILVLAVGGDVELWRPDGDIEVDDGILGEAQAAGLVTEDGTLIESVRNTILTTVAGHRVRAIQRKIVDALVVDGRLLSDRARSLARGGLVDLRIARVLEREGDRLLLVAPDHAAELYEEAIGAGADSRALAARRAQVAWAAGDLDTAGRIVDDHLADDSAPDRGRAIDVGAAVWASRGMLGRSSELYRWHGTEMAATSAAFAAVAMIGAGDRNGAAAMLASAGSSSPTVVSVAASLMAQGVRDSLEGSGVQALPTLIRASDMMTASGAVVPVPESPAALAALVAIQGGDVAVAGSVLEEALERAQGGAAARTRLLLLRGWVAMLEDRVADARAAVAEADAGDGRLTARDELLSRALAVGIARRTDAVAELTGAWRRAHDSILHVAIDLFDLLPVGELVVASARLGESDKVRYQLDEAWNLLERLGSPLLWCVPLHWASVQAAILAGEPRSLAPDAAALVRAGEHSRPAAMMSTAGRAWLDVLAGRVDAAAVDDAARGLATVGLGWDGARLAGHAAARAADRKEMSRLLACARELRRAGLDPSATDTPASDPAQLHGDGSVGRPELSSREREVAQLVLQGKNYREIGETMFISPRTVEHHMERIRHRLAATSRSEMLAQLRVVLGDEDGVL